MTPLRAAEAAKQLRVPYEPEEGSARLVFVWNSVCVYEDSLKLVEDAMQG